MLGLNNHEFSFEGYSIAVVCMKKEGKSKTGGWGLMASPRWRVLVSRSDKKNNCLKLGEVLSLHRISSWLLNQVIVALLVILSPSPRGNTSG